MRRLLALLLLTSAALTGCQSKATGYGGNLTFAYASNVEPENFVKPLAPGAKLEVVALANGSDDEELAISKAWSSKPGVLVVESVDARAIVLRGIEPGVAEVEITATDGAGKQVVDKMFFHVARPATHGLEHACTRDESAAYVRGANVDVFHALATRDRRPLVGYAYVPVAVEPRDALELVSQPQASQVYRYRANAVREGVRVRSTVDESTLTVTIVDRAELRDAELHAPETMLEGEEGYAAASVGFGDVPLCSQDALTKARSLTPDVCEVTAKLDDDPSPDSNRWQLAQVHALKMGRCEIEMTLPELAGGRGVVLRATTKVGRVEYPKGAGLEGKWQGAALVYLLTRAAALGFVFVWTIRRRRR